VVSGLEMVRGYQRAWLRGDLLAGVTVAAYLIPQVAIVTEQLPCMDAGPQPSPTGYEPVVFACSVRGQVQALRWALASRQGH
jgi:hypothetical protein